MAYRTRTGRGSIAAVISAIGGVLALILILHILFVFLDANPGNEFVSWIRWAANGLVIFFAGLFTPDNPKLAVFLNFGIAAVFWLVVTGILARLARRA